MNGIKYGTWIRDEDYLRLDGSTNAPSRKRLTTNFNDVSNTRFVNASPPNYIPTFVFLCDIR